MNALEIKTLLQDAIFIKRLMSKKNKNIVDKTSGEDMRASFDGVRKNLADSFNRLAETDLTQDQIKEMRNMRECIIALLCMYDDSCADDCHDLIGEVKLKEFPWQDA